MKRNEIVFLILVGLFAAALAAATLYEAAGSLAARARIAAPQHDAGGEARDLDLEKIRYLIRTRKLSDREAEFYRTIGPEEPQKPQ